MTHLRYRTRRQTKDECIATARSNASFIAYIAPFNATFRLDLWSGKWMPDILERKIPSTEGFKPMNLLTDASIGALAGSCPLLESVNLAFCKLLTDVSIGALAESAFRTMLDELKQRAPRQYDTPYGPVAF